MVDMADMVDMVDAYFSSTGQIVIYRLLKRKRYNHKLSQNNL